MLVKGLRKNGPSRLRVREVKPVGSLGRVHDGQNGVHPRVADGMGGETPVAIGVEERIRILIRLSYRPTRGFFLKVTN